MLQALLERLDVEKPQSRQTSPPTRRQLPYVKQLGLIFTNVPRTQAVRGTVESSSKIFDCVDVVRMVFFRVITTLEFLQHQFTKMGHGNASL